MTKTSSAITGQIFLLIIEGKQIKVHAKVFSLVCSVFIIKAMMVEVSL